MKSAVVKRSIVISGHKTSVSLEDQFWICLKAIAKNHNATLSALVADIESNRQFGNLSSAIRLFVLEHIRAQASSAKIKLEPASWFVARRWPVNPVRSVLGAPIIRRKYRKIIFKYWTRVRSTAISGAERSTIVDAEIGASEVMTNNVEELQSEIQRLRDLVISLSTTLLRNIELDPPQHRRNVSTADAEHLLQEAEIYFRCSRITGLNKEATIRLEVAGNELMAKVVEVETTLQREKWKK